VRYYTLTSKCKPIQRTGRVCKDAVWKACVMHAHHTRFQGETELELRVGQAVALRLYM
jgi:hypothetical protein